jgi:hypothetical protein
MIMQNKQALHNKEKQQALHCNEEVAGATLYCRNNRRCTVMQK